MTIKSKVSRLPIEDYSHLEPLPDPPWEPDMQRDHVRYDFVSALQAHFADRDDVLIASGGFVRNEASNDAERLAPDLVIAFGVRGDAIVSRNGYVISEVGKPPDWVLEIASRATGRRDYTYKRDAYAAYGIGEYWRFDRTGGRFHDAPLAGDTLIDGSYTPIRLTRGSDRLIWGRSPTLEPDLVWGRSPTLEPDLVWDDGDLQLRKPLSDEYLPDAKQLSARIGTAEERAGRAEKEREEAVAELSRLRTELGRLQRRSG